MSYVDSYWLNSLYVSIVLGAGVVSVLKLLVADVGLLDAGVLLFAVLVLLPTAVLIPIAPITSSTETNAKLLSVSRFLRRAVPAL